MSRLLLIFAVAAACGGTSTPPPVAPVPPEPQASAPPPPAAPAPPPPAPMPPPGPVELTIPAQSTTVKLVAGGKGKKQPMRYTSRAGSKQAIELAMDFTGQQDADEQIVPTIVLLGEAETRAVDKDGTAEYTVTVTGADARPVTGSQVPVDELRAALESLSGLTIGGTLGTNGLAGDVTLRMEHPPALAADTLEMIRLLLPTLPVLPREAVGVGAKWQSTTEARFADKLEVTQVTDYEVVAHKGKTWTIKGTTRVTGKEQQIEDSKVWGISGSGTSETTIAEGALYPTHKASLETRFMSLEKERSSTFAIKVGGAVTPRL